MEIDAVHVDEVEIPAAERAADGVSGVALGGGADGIGQFAAAGARDGKQLARGHGSLAGDHHGAMAAAHQFPVEQGEHLLGAAGGVGADGRERVSDAEDRELHRGTARDRSLTVAAR